jgi:hypothetical protein
MSRARNIVGDGREVDLQADEWLLGVIETHLVGGRCRSRIRSTDPRLLVRREPENPQDPSALRVENEKREMLGYLPREVAVWLAPLVDRGTIRVEAQLPTADRAATMAAAARPIVLTVFARQEAQAWLRDAEVQTAQDALHTVVRRAYEEAQRYTDPHTVRGLMDGLRRLEGISLLPQTRLLLALLPGVARRVAATGAIRMQEVFRGLLTQLLVGPPLRSDWLTIFPLHWPSAEEPHYVLLADAIDTGTAVVEEITEDGSVPNLRLINRGLKPLLIPEGEILVGAKQNRVVNATVLVAADSTFTLPVSCVEQGRWGYQSRQFRSAFCAPPSLRSRKMRSVQASRARRGTAESDQGEVWATVCRNLVDLGVASPTRSLADGYTSLEAKFRAARQEIRLPEATAGIVVTRGNQVIGMDLFDSPRTFARQWDRLADAYLFDALRDERSMEPADSDVAPQFLDAVAGRGRLRESALGLGEELEISGGGMVGTALLYSGRLVHLAAFSQPEQPEEST